MILEMFKLDGPFLNDLDFDLELKQLWSHCHLIFIPINKRIIHVRMGIQILSSSDESISHEWAKRKSERYIQHEKIKLYPQAAM